MSAIKVGKQLVVMVMLIGAAMLLAACGSSGVGATISPTLTPQPTSIPKSAATPAAVASPTAGSTSAVTDRASLVAALKAAGLTVSDGDKIEQPFLSVAGQTLKVNGQTMQSFEYADSSALAQDAAKISPDGQIATMMITWVEQPHFYKAGRLLVIYPGSDQAVLSALGTVLGSPFANGKSLK